MASADIPGLGRRRPRMAEAAKAAKATDPNIRPLHHPNAPELDKAASPPLGPHPRAPGECEWCGTRVRHLAAHKRGCKERPHP